MGVMAFGAGRNGAMVFSTFARILSSNSLTLLASRGRLFGSDAFMRINSASTISMTSGCFIDQSGSDVFFEFSQAVALWP